MESSESGREFRRISLESEMNGGFLDEIVSKSVLDVGKG